MAKFDGFEGSNGTQIKLIHKAALKTLEAAVKQLEMFTFRSNFEKWMGTRSGAAAVSGGGSRPNLQSASGAISELNLRKEAEDRLRSTIKEMFNRLNTMSFTVVYDAQMAPNADMVNMNGASISEHRDQVDDYRTSDKADAVGPLVRGGGLVMRIGPNVWSMPFTSFTDQSQVETYLHELSHFAVGTIDDELGGECYGLTGVQRLRSVGFVRAVRNAENVGFFLMEYYKP